MQQNWSADRTLAEREEGLPAFYPAVWIKLRRRRGLTRVITWSDPPAKEMRTADYTRWTGSMGFSVTRGGVAYASTLPTPTTNFPNFP